MKIEPVKGRGGVVRSVRITITEKDAVALTSILHPAVRADLDMDPAETVRIRRRWLCKLAGVVDGLGVADSVDCGLDDAIEGDLQSSREYLDARRLVDPGFMEGEA